MSKYINWQVPFVSVKGVEYRVDIYADTVCTAPKQLTAGAEPFVTDEDDDDDFFAPVRTQTGTLTIIDEDGSRLEELMPKDNIDRPVRLMAKENGSWVCKWQGFLSCEAYSQDYTSRPQELQLNVNSVLEAMKSVTLDEDVSEISNIKDLIVGMFESINEQAGIDGFVYRLYISDYGYDILNQYIDTTCFAEFNEQDSENSVIYTISRKSINEVLEVICTYMGWVAREDGDCIYMSMEQDTKLDIIKMTDEPEDEDTYVTIDEQEEKDFDWMGTGHEVEYAEGAKSVEVVAAVEDYDLELDLPESPAGTYSESGDHNPVDDYHVCAYGLPKADSYEGFVELHAYQAEGCTNSIGDVAYRTTCNEVGLTEAIAKAVPFTNQNLHQIYRFLNTHTYHEVYAGAFFAKEGWSEESYDEAKKELEDYLHVVVFPGSLCPVFSRVPDNYIFSMRTGVSRRFNCGCINITGQILQYIYNGSFKLVEKRTNENSLVMCLRFGDKYFDGTGWSDTKQTFEWVIEEDDFKGNWDSSMNVEEGDGIFIPITENMFGEIELQIWPEGGYNDSELSHEFFCDLLFKELSVKYVEPIDKISSDRSENHYYKLLGTNFSEDISVDTDIASDLNNKVSPSIIMTDENATTLKSLTYHKSETETEDIRPEKNLLEMLAAYYKQVRKNLTLEIERVAEIPWALMKVIGYAKDTDKDGNRREYLPLAESRDWRNDTSTVKLFEKPQE